MDELWQQDKLIIVVGLFQFAIIAIMSIILNSFKSNQKSAVPQIISSAVSEAESTNDQSPTMSKQDSNFSSIQLPMTMSAVNDELSNQANHDLNYGLNYDVNYDLSNDANHYLNNGNNDLSNDLSRGLRGDLSGDLISTSNIKPNSGQSRDIADSPTPIAPIESAPSQNLDLLQSLPEVAKPNSIEISPDLFKELLEVSDNPAATVDEAIRWWLRRRDRDALQSAIDRRDRFARRSPTPWRSLEEAWND